jgi:KDO2-lipid IV(A) lauroyltransferase
VGAVLGWIAGSVLRIRRAEVEAALRASGVPAAGDHARAMYRSLGTSAAEFLWLAGRGNGACPHARIDGRSKALLAAALSAGRGVVLAASHTANWDLAACALAGALRADAAGDLLVITKHLRARGLDRFWQEVRAGRGVALADAVGAMTRARAILERGGAVAMMIDQVPASLRHAVRGVVLGRPAWIDRSPATVAARWQAPLLVTAGRRDAAGEHHLSVLGVFEPPPRAGRAWITATTLAASAALDAFVRANPDQWLWLHRRWRDPLVPAGPTATSTTRGPTLQSLSP